MIRTLGCERAKDMASDHVVEPKQVEKARNPFAGMKLRPHDIVRPTPLDRAVERFARATADTLRMRGDGYEPLIHQQVACDTAAKALDTLRPNATRDLTRAFEAEPALIDEAAKGRTSAAIRAMQLEAEIRIDRRGFFRIIETARHRPR